MNNSCVSYIISENDGLLFKKRIKHNWKIYISRNKINNVINKKVIYSINTQTKLKYLKFDIYTSNIGQSFCYDNIETDLFFDEKIDDIVLN